MSLTPKEMADFLGCTVAELSPEDLAKCRSPHRPLQPWSWDDLENEPDPVWEVGDQDHPLQLTQTLALIFGPYGAAKTFYAVEKAFCRAFDIPFHGLPVQQGDAAYVIAEGSKKRFRDVRFAALFEKHREIMVARGYNDARDALNSGHFHLIASAVDLVNPDNKRGTKELIAELEGFSPLSEITFDTWARMLAAGAGNASSQEDVPAALNSCDMLRARFGGTVVLVAHSGVAKDAQERPMGMTDAPALADTIVRAAKEGDGIDAWYRFKVTKARDAESGFELFAQLKEFGGGVALANRSGVDFKTSKFSGAQRTAMAELARLGGSLVADAEWREACKAVDLWPDNPDSTSKQNAAAWRWKWKRLKDGLCAAGAIDDASGSYSIHESAGERDSGAADFAEDAS